MNDAQGAAPTGESVGTTPQPQPEPQPSPEPAPQPQPPRPSMRDAVMAGLELPEGVLKVIKGEAQGEPAPEKPEPGPAEPEPAPEPPTERADLPPGDQPLPDDWSPSAKARVAEEAEKRRQRTAERDAWKQEAEKLNLQVQQLRAQQGAPPPTSEDPLSDVMDFGNLQRVTRVNRDLKEWCERHPDGADNVVYGRDAQGNELRRDYTREEVIDMKIFADRVLEAVPVRGQYLADLAAAAKQAQQDYPELFEDTTESRMAAQMLQANPWLRQRPDFLLTLGDYITGRKDREAKKNGQRKTATASGKPLSAGAEKILSAPKVTPAPGVVRRSGPEIQRGPATVSGDGEIQKARQEYIDSGFSEEGMEKVIAAKLARRFQGRGGKEPTLA